MTGARQMTRTRTHIPAALAAILLLGGSSLMLAAAAFPPGGRPAATQPATQPSGQPSDPVVPGTVKIPTPESQFVKAIRLAHNAEVWDRKPAIRAYMLVTFGGTEVIDGTLTYEMATGRARLDLVQGDTLIFDGTKAFISPSNSDFDRPRFHLLTWPYFLAAPFKLEDPGTRLELIGPQTLNMKVCDAALLSFEKTAGDTPDDWFYVCVDDRTRRLAGLVYIHTYGRSVEEANEDPMAIVYTGYRTIEGVKLSTTWTFYHWSTTLGSYGPPAGRARITNIEFITPEPGTFDVPADAREDQLPGH